jgi:hypothetical protein
MWEIIVGIGVGPLRFGMSPDQVAALPEMGPPDRARSAPGGGLIERRGPTRPVVSYRDAHLIDIDMEDVLPVRLGTLDVFTTDPRAVMAALFEANGGAALAGFGYIFFDRLGLNTEGFFDMGTGLFHDPQREDNGRRGMAAIAPAEIAGMAEGMKPVTMSADGIVLA